MVGKRHRALSYNKLALTEAQHSDTYSMIGRIHSVGSHDTKGKTGKDTIHYLSGELLRHSKVTNLVGSQCHPASREYQGSREDHSICKSDEAE